MVCGGRRDREQESGEKMKKKRSIFASYPSRFVGLPGRKEWWTSPLVFE